MESKHLIVEGHVVCTDGKLQGMNSDGKRGGTKWDENWIVESKGMGKNAVLRTKG